MYSYYGKRFNIADKKIESRTEAFQRKAKNLYNIYRDRYHNEKLQEIVKNVYEKKKIIRYKNRLIQQTDPIFLDADNMGFFGFRSHFYAPRKWFCGRYYDTFSFNIMILWLFSLLFYVTLYYDLLKKLVDWGGNLSLKGYKEKLLKLIPKKGEKQPAASVEETPKEKKTVAEEKTE